MIPSSVGEECGTQGEATKTVMRKPGRLWEVDAARGIAILMMAFYHLTYDLDTFGGYAIESTSGYWALFADTTASLFLFLVGVSLTISYIRAGGESAGNLFGKYLLRGLRVFGYGMVLTLVTWVAGVGIIVFGILHLIGVSIILAYPLLRFRLPNLVLGVVMIVVGEYMRLQGVSSESPLLLPLGVVPESLFMPDYRPLLPWFGVVLLGVFFGNLLYGRGYAERRAGGESPVAARPLGFLGRHSLLIYLVHQPVIIALLAVLGIIEFGGL
ncbi:MAG TPA: heparan-alpha-glucosaminide N-acetyltransferase [Rubrobacteraceae bacterium]|nr:heparan-alpha-glucosaminide N-acetyltransferase [Rubrobacteraceae bacterium]